MNSTKCDFRIVALAVIFAFLFATAVMAQQEPDTTTIEINGRIHSPSELLRLIERSNLVYELGEDTTLTMQHPEREVFRTPYYIDSSHGEWELRNYNMSDSGSQLLTIADGAFEARDFAAALELYKEVYDLDPSVSHILTLIGNCYFMLGDYRSAVSCFEMSIDSNYYDCWAHWFLADAAWIRGDSARAVEEITIAHLLNRNHEQLLENLVHYRQATGAGWEDWTFEPVYAINQDTSDAHRIEVRCNGDWCFYAVVKALWKYEPNYAETMLANIESPYDELMLQEREATICQLVATKGEDYTLELLDSNLLDYFIIYEITSRDNPDLLYRSTPETLKTFAKYLDTYH
ncbi:MAG: tetratricopeptide repeat protein [Candidatus Zixiibacteriota bacterium]